MCCFMITNISLHVNGSKYKNWKQLSVNTSMTNISGAFRVSLTESIKLPIKKIEFWGGEKCELYLNDQIVISGYVDQIEHSYTATTHSITISGRDKTADLADCTLDDGPYSYSNIKLDKLANQLVKKFGIGVNVLTAPEKVFKTFEIEQGETIFEALERAAKFCSVLLMTDHKGNLVIDRAGRTHAKTELVEGVNIIEASATYSFNERFSNYYVRGQQPNTDDTFGSAAAEVEGKSYDKVIKRYRPKVIISEGAVDIKTATERAAWQANINAAKSSVCTIKVKGWEQSENRLWRENERVKVNAPQIRVFNKELLISEVAYSLDFDGGQNTTLSLVGKNAFDKIPEIESDKSENWKN